MTKAAREPRRLETGDWVRVRGDDPSIRGVGKLVDADFAREDGALTACQVEVGARSLWLPPADLVRITPDEEARLCDVALARGLVPDERRARLDAALRELRAGRRAVIRTPGLLDLLWATSTLADPTHGSGAVTAFLAEEAFAPIRSARATPAPEPLLERPRVRPAPAPEPDFVPEAPAAPTDERLLRVLAPLDRTDLIGVASRCGVNLGPNPVALDQAMMQRLIVAAGVTAVQAASALDPRHPPREVLEQALAVLEDDQLAPLAAECGLQRWVDGRDAFLSLPSPDLLRQALDLLTENQLHSLCDRLGMEPLWGTFDATEVCARIAATASARPVAPAATPLDGRVPPEEVLMRLFDLLSRAPLFALAARFGLESVASENRVGLLREALQALPPAETLRRVLAELPTSELMELAARVGLREGGFWDPASVRARIANVAGL